MKRNIFLSVLLALSFCSCTKNVQEETVVYVDVPFYATLGETDDAESKTTLDTANGKVKWSVGDTIRLYNAYYKGLSSKPLEETDILENGKTAKFIFSMQEKTVEPSSAIHNYLFYGQQNPNFISEGESSGQITGINLPAVQTYTPSGFGENENVAIGYCPAGQKSCVLKNIFGILKVHITLVDNSNQSIENQSIEYVQLKDNGSTYLAGNFQLTGLEDGTPTLAHKVGSEGGDSRIVDKRIPVGTNLGGGDFYFMIPPGTLANGFDVLVYTRSGYYGGKRITFASGTEIRRSEITSIKINVKEKPAPVPTYSKTANSYIFGVPTTGGFYTIQAQYCGNGYQGNGDDDDVPARSHDLRDYGKYAGFLWQTKCNGDDIEGTDIVSAPTFYRDESGKGFITFRASGQKGNALLALKDGSGTILWSWHIWIVSQQDSIDIAKGIVLKNQSAENSQIAGIIMDRNLGALSTNVNADGSQTFGLTYQYGRKDPFMGSRFIYGGGSTYDDFMSHYPPHTIDVDNTYSQFTIEQSIKYPTKRTSISDGSWSSEKVSWGSEHGIGTNSKKSLYDPCPVGWRTIEEIVLITALGQKSDGTINRPIGELIPLSSSQAVYFKLTGISASPIILPAAGISSTGNSLDDVGKTVALWGASIAKIAQTEAVPTQAYYLMVSPDNEKTYISDFKVENMRATLPVRCVKWDEDKFEIVTTQTESN